MSVPPTQPDSATVNELFELVEDSLRQAKQAYTELATERSEKVRLEKVASDARRIDMSLVNQTVGLLVRHNYLDESNQEKFASELAARPENALRLVNRLVEISAPNLLNEGRGVPKQASARDAEPTEEDLVWSRVLKEGA